jgi:hypothetical protein
VYGHNDFMSLDIQPILTSEIAALQSFEQKRLAEFVPDEDERKIQSWHARWRQESLEHYLNLGWSFAAKDDGEVKGYFLAQPLLFFDGQTQSLWIEHVQFTNIQARDVLCDFIYKLAREKHLQKVYFPKETNQGSIANGLTHFKPEAWIPPVLQVKTTKT